MALMVMSIFLILVARSFFRDQNTISLILSYSLLSPYIQVAGKKIDSIYIVILVLFAFLIMKNKGIIRISHPFVKYYMFILLIYIIYFISWILFNRNNGADMIPIYLGAVKWILYMQICYQMNTDISKSDLKNEIYLMIVIVSILNFALAIIQKTNVNAGLLSIEGLQSSASYSYALDKDTVNAYGFRRCFGIMAYPMNLGMFSALAIAYISVFYKSETQMIILIGMNAITGVLSATKSFFFGVILTFICLFAFSYYLDKGIKRKTLIYIVAFLVIALFSYIYFDSIYYFIYEKIGPNYARYWGLIKSPSSIFSGRYSESARDLAYMPSFLRKYWILGAGPVSITDEAVMDSALYVILHGGGVILLIIVFGYYTTMLLKMFKNKEKECVLLLLMILFFGAGFNTLVSSEISMWVLYFMLAVLDNRNRCICNSQ